MPARLIRDGLLESEAVLSLPVEARWLYVSILLSADDVGLFEATPFRLARRADVRREMADKLLEMLVDVDLVRLYEKDGKRYGFIPRYRQRLQLRRGKHPLPPDALIADDEDAVNKIKDLVSKSTVKFGDSPCFTAAQPLEAEAEAEAKTEKNHASHGGETPVGASPSERAEAAQTTGLNVVPIKSDIPECPHQEILALWAQLLPTARQPADWTSARQTLLRSRWREKRNRQSIEWWERFFGYVSKSDFLMGRTQSSGRKPFLLSLDWLLKSENFLKVIEGAYENASAEVAA